MKKKTTRLPDGWNEERVQAVITHYEAQTEDEAVAEDEAVFEAPEQTVMQLPSALVPRVRDLVAKYEARSRKVV